MKMDPQMMAIVKDVPPYLVPALEEQVNAVSQETSKRNLEALRKSNIDKMLNDNGSHNMVGALINLAISQRLEQLNNGPTFQDYKPGLGEIMQKAGGNDQYLAGAIEMEIAQLEAERESAFSPAHIENIDMQIAGHRTAMENHRRLNEWQAAGGLEDDKPELAYALATNAPETADKAE
jgi:hypothetical protein